MATKQSKETLKDFVLGSDQDTLDGFEQINGETMSVPFLRLIQKLSPQIDKKKPEYIEGAVEGDFFNTVTKEVYGQELALIVLRFERIYIEWKPNRGGFVGYHSPEDAERIATKRDFGKWQTEKGNELQENYVYMVILGGHEKEGPMILSLSSSGIKTAREWNRLMVTHIMSNGQKAKPYYLMWQVNAKYKENEKGSWYSPIPKFMGYINEQQYNIASNERKLLPSRKVDYAQLEARIEPDTEY